MQDRAQFAIRAAALERVREDFEVMFYEADLVFSGLNDPAARARSDELALLHLLAWWLRYRAALVHNLEACDDWARVLRSAAALGAEV